MLTHQRHQEHADEDRQHQQCELETRGVDHVSVIMLQIHGLGFVGGRALLTGQIRASPAFTMHGRRRRDLVHLWLMLLLFERHIDERSDFDPEPDVDEMRAFSGPSLHAATLKCAACPKPKQEKAL